MTKMTIAEALRQAIREEMTRDATVFCMGEDIGVTGGFGGAFTVTLGLSDEFGHERILDTPSLRSAWRVLPLARPCQACGQSPMCSTAILILYDGSACQPGREDDLYVRRNIKMPLVMRAPVGATARGAQHAQSLEAFFTHIPGLKVLAPSTAYDAKGLLKSAVRDDNPVLIFEHKLLYGSKGSRTEKGALSPVGEVPDEEYLVPIGKGIIRRAGKDVTIVASCSPSTARWLRLKSWRRGHPGRGDRPAHPGAFRQRPDP